MESISDVYRIYHEPSLNAVVMEWDGYSTSDQFKEGTELMLNTLVQNQTYKVLADIKDMVLIGMEDQKWLEKDFLPRAINFGFKAIAIITPDHYFNKVAVESISYKVDKEKLTLCFFDNIEEAKEWIRKV